MHYCGNVHLDVDIYPVWDKQRGRGPKRRPTSEVQVKLNQKNAERELARILDTNFTQSDLRFDLTYNDKHLPSDDDEALRDAANFLRRVKYLRRKLCLPELKCVIVTAVGVKSGRYHHHIVMSGGLSIEQLSGLWRPRGFTTLKPLELDDNGFVGIANYFARQNSVGKRWRTTRNLARPTIQKRDGKISAKRVTEWAFSGYDCHEAIERQYPGYRLVSSEALLNEVNCGVYLSLHLVRDRSFDKRVKGKNKRC